MSGGSNGVRVGWVHFVCECMVGGGGRGERRGG